MRPRVIDELPVLDRFFIERVQVTGMRTITYERSVYLNEERFAAFFAEIACAVVLHRMAERVVPPGWVLALMVPALTTASMIESGLIE